MKTFKELFEKTTELDELSKDTLKSYHKKAVDTLVKGDVRLDKFKKREKGAMAAFNKAYKDVKEETVSEELDDIEEANKPGWMLKQDKELAKKVKEKTDLAKKRQATYGDKSAGKSVSEDLDEAVHTNLPDWETHAKKLGYAVTKDNKTATYHAWQGTTHKGSFKAGSGSGKVEEANMSSDRSKQIFKRNELDHELRHEVEPKRAEPADPHAVHINGKKWKTFPTKSHATNVAKKIAGATVVKESVELDEAEDFHAEAMEHKKKSDAAMDKNDMEAYHHHMSAHHEAMGQWHESKGRSSSADKEYEKAESHHELSLKKSKQKNEGTDMLSFKYFQEVLEEAKKKMKNSSCELENAHDMDSMKEDLDEEEQRELEEAINEVLSKDEPAGKWISDFIHSDNPKFAGKSKEKRKQMALAAYYAKQRNEEVELDEVSPFDWKAYSKERGSAADKKTKTFHDVKKTSTGTVYTKQVNPDGTSKGSGDDAAKASEKEQAPKRGRGRPAGVGAKTGSYKPRDPAKKAASAAKAAASKAAGRAMRKESFDEEFMSSLIEGFEDEDFDDFLQCEEFSELDEDTQDTLFDFINEKNASRMKESLTGGQKKLDKNKNGKLDSHDFKLLRKEETEQIQESVSSYAAFLNKK